MIVKIIVGEKTVIQYNTTGRKPGDARAALDLVPLRGDFITLQHPQDHEVLRVERREWATDPHGIEFTHLNLYCEVVSESLP